MAAAMAAGEVVKVPTSPTLADGLAVPTVGPRSFEVLRPRVDKLVTVSEQDISVALLRLVETEKLVQEGAGAAGIAACLAGKLPELEGKNVAVLLCGGNIDTSTLGNVLERGLVNDGRLIRFSAVVPDRPGGIAGLCAVIAFVGASIKQIVHERAWLQEDSHAVQVDVTCELTGLEMKETLYKALSEKYAVDFSLSKSNLNMNMVGKDSAGMMAAESKNGADAKTYSFDAIPRLSPGDCPRPCCMITTPSSTTSSPAPSSWVPWRMPSPSSPTAGWTCPSPCTSVSPRPPKLDPVTATSRAGTSRVRLRGL